MSHMQQGSSDILVPEIMHRARKTAPDVVKSRPAWLKPQSAERIGRILVAHRAAEQGFKTFAVGVVLAGMELSILRKETGGGRWGDVLTNYLIPAGITEKHAERYIDVAAATTRKHRIEAAALLESPSTVSAEVWAKLTDHVTSTTNATTWRGLIEGMGMVKRETRGGYRADPALVMRFAAERDLESDFDAWVAETQAAFKAWVRELTAKTAVQDDGRAQKRAEANWMPTIGLLQAACERHASWMALPKEERQRFRDLCRQLAEKIESTL